MMGLCYYWSCVTLCIFFLNAVVMMNFQAALLVTLVGIVVSAPVSQNLDIMDKETIEEAHSLISKILQDIPTTHASWITSKSLTWGDSTSNLQYFRSMIPSAPVLQNITNISSLETCLVSITNGLKLHLNLLKELSKATQTEKVKALQADIQELLDLIEKLQNQAGFDPTKQASDEQSQSLEQELANNLTSEYKTHAMAHLTLQQLQDFSSDILHRILSIRSMTSSISETQTFELSL